MELFSIQEIFFMFIFLKWITIWWFFVGVLATFVVLRVTSKSRFSWSCGKCLFLYNALGSSMQYSNLEGFKL